MIGGTDRTRDRATLGDAILAASCPWSVSDLDPASIDWAALIPVAAPHRVLPLVAYDVERRGGLERVEDAAAREALRAEYERSRARANAYLDELGAILGELEVRGIDCLVISGEMLAARHYPEPALRPFGDLDLLVADGHMRELAAVLEARGFRQGFAEHGEIREPTSFERRFARMYMKHPIAWVQYRGDELFVVEPHQTLFWRSAGGRPAFGLGMDEILGRSIEVELCGAKARVMTPSDQLMYLCIDLYEDARRIEKIARAEDLQLVRFLDVRAVLRGGVDAVAFTETIRTWGMEVPAACALTWLDELYGDVPRGLFAGLEDVEPRERDRFGFPEELVADSAGCFYDRGLRERLFDLEYRRAAVRSRESELRQTTFQRLKSEGDG